METPAPPSLTAPSERDWLRLLGHPATSIHCERNGYRTVTEAATTRVDGTPYQLLDRALPWHLLYFVLRSTVRTVVDGREGILQPGSFLWLAPGIRHSFAFDCVHFVTLFHILLRIERGGKMLPPPHRVLQLDDAEELEAPMQVLHEVLDLGGRHAADMHRAGLAMVSAKALARRSEPTPERRLDVQQCRRLQDVVAQRQAHVLHPRELARELGLSHDYFTRLFRATYGITPRIWLNRQRVRNAAEHLLQDRGPIGTVAATAGYPDLFSFSKQFRKVMGESPSHFRRRHGIR